MVRSLLSHSSGASYKFADPGLVKLAEAKGKQPNTGTTVLERFSYPLLFEPGTGWMYGSSIDWAGKLIERITNQSLGQYFEKNISEPLGIKSLKFFSHTSEKVKDKIPVLSARGPDGKLVPFPDGNVNLGAEDCFGGDGAYATAEDYLKVQRSILANDGKLLKPESVDMMFAPQLSAESKDALQEFRASPLGKTLIGEQDLDVVADWGIGGLLFMQDDKLERRKRGTLHWGGFANTFWTIDRSSDLALNFGTQILPPGDPPTSNAITAVELGVYEMRGLG